MQLLLVLSLVFAGARALSLDSDTHEAHEWSYASQHEWPALAGMRACGQRAQSPVNIEPELATPSAQLRFELLNYEQPTSFLLMNAGHTVRMSWLAPGQSAGNETSTESAGSSSNTDASLAVDTREGREPETREGREPETREAGQAESGAQASLGRRAPPRGRPGAANRDLEREESVPDGSPAAPAIRLNWLDDDNNEFRLREVHFHWAHARDAGSEHAIAGRRAAMEMHLVHVKPGLSAAQLARTSDSMAVIAVLIEPNRRSSADLNPVSGALPEVNMSSAEQLLSYGSLTDLLPDSLDAFYTYSGSLTTPPCSQVVNWLVLADRLYLNAKQLELFRSLWAPARGEYPAHPIGPNVRLLQPLNNRTILASFGRFQALQAEPSEQSDGARALLPGHALLLVPLALLLGLAARRAL